MELLTEDSMYKYEIIQQSINAIYIPMLKDYYERFGYVFILEKIPYKNSEYGNDKDKMYENYCITIACITHEQYDKVDLANVAAVNAIAEAKAAEEEKERIESLKEEFVDPKSLSSVRPISMPRNNEIETVFTRFLVKFDKVADAIITRINGSETAPTATVVTALVEAKDVVSSTEK